MSTDKEKKACCSPAFISLLENLGAIALTVIALAIAMCRADQRALDKAAFDRERAVGYEAYEDRMTVALNEATTGGDANRIPIEHAIAAVAEAPEFLKTVPIGHEPEPPSAGALLFRAACAACHAPEAGTAVCPPLNGRFGGKAELADGTSVDFNEEYVISSIKDPGSQIAKGFQPIMPAGLADNLSDDQMKDLITFIKGM